MTNRLRCAIGIAAITIYVGLALFVLTRRLLEPTPEILAAGVASFVVLVAIAIYSCGWCACFGKKETTSDGYERAELATVPRRPGLLMRYM